MSYDGMKTAGKRWGVVTAKVTESQCLGSNPDPTFNNETLASSLAPKSLSSFMCKTRVMTTSTPQGSCKE